MKVNFVAVALAAASIWTGGAVAQASPPVDEPATERLRSLDPEAAPPAATIDDVAWIAGSWKGSGFGGRVRETWSEPVSGTMLGMYRHDGEDGATFYELQLLAEEDDTLVWKVKHFDPDFVGWEEKDGFVTFPLVEVGDRIAYFDGLTVQQTAPHELTIWLRVRSGETMRVEEVRMTRSDLSGSSD